MYLKKISTDAEGVREAELRALLEATLAGRALKRVLLAPPDITRLNSGAGRIANLYYHMLAERGVEADVIPAVGTHAPMTAEEAALMFGDIPFDRFLTHNWRTDVVRLGEAPGEWLGEISEGLWKDPIAFEVDRRVMDPRYDLVLSIGQVVPHEVIGMANHAKNLFVGLGGSDMINKSHMLGAVYGMERMMGRDHTPVRRMFDYGMERFLGARPILFVLTVTTVTDGRMRINGVFAGETRRTLESAIALSQRLNVEYVPQGIKKCVTFLDPTEFHTTWLGNKAIYRTRMAIADGGELVVLAPGVTHYGEDPEADRLIRKYGYKGRLRTLELFNDPANADLRDNMAAAAHLIHGSADGRFSVTYAVKHLSRESVESVGFGWADYDETAKRYDPAKLRQGFNTLPDGEEIYLIPNPAIGLWMRDRNQ